MNKVQFETLVWCPCPLLAWSQFALDLTLESGHVLLVYGPVVLLSALRLQVTVYLIDVRHVRVRVIAV